ncbi:MAG: ACT domain-containing protein [Pseudomonadota bacterium]
MTGEMDLTKLVVGMSPELTPGVFVFVSCPRDAVPEGLTPLMRYEEAEGTTLILPREEAERLGLEATFPCRRITLRIHSALEAVGFIAAVATHLAKNGMGANPVSGFHHDHLFVAEKQAERAVEVLRELAAG